MMNLSGLHLLLTFQCTFECDHCFVWGSPWQTGTMTLEDITNILEQARLPGTVKSIYFEGGEPFLYYPVLVKGIELAVDMGFQAGIVTNAYWATSYEDALTWLQPLAGKISDISVSSDLFHYDKTSSLQAQNAEQAAGALDIPVGLISIADPQRKGALNGEGQLPSGESGVMFRGRAAEKLTPHVAHHAWESFDKCPYENLIDPGRVHVDPLGNIHLCQGIVIGNLYKDPLNEICTSYNPTKHPIIGPILAGGSRQLVDTYGLAHQAMYADACHLCYESRSALRGQFPAELAPDQVYGMAG